MDIASSNANDNRNNIEYQQQLLGRLLPLDRNRCLTPGLLSFLQQQQQQQQQQQNHRGQQPNRCSEFSSSASTTAAVLGAIGAPISSLGPLVHFCHPICHPQHPPNILSIAEPQGHNLTDPVFRSYWDLQDSPILLELKGRWTERALLLSALTPCQSLGRNRAPQTSLFSDVINPQLASSSQLAQFPSSTIYHSSPCSPAEAPRAGACAGAYSSVPLDPQGPRDSVVAGTLASCKSKESHNQSGLSKPTVMARQKASPRKSEKKEMKTHFRSKRFSNVHVNRERRRYNAESFAQKLFRLITDQERAGNTHIVEFIDGGGGFWLRQPEAISKLMPKYNFRGCKLSGFRRQLYSYGFRVEKDGPNKGAFKHTSFSRGNAELCKQIRRDGTYDFGPYDLDSCDESDKSDGRLEVIDDGM